MRVGFGMKAGEMHKVFAKWNKGKLDSYLIEITRDILGFKDTDGKPLVDRILDAAEQKAPASGRASRRWIWGFRSRWWSRPCSGARSPR